jgi:hypothetical protein
MSQSWELLFDRGMKRLLWVGAVAMLLFPLQATAQWRTPNKAGTVRTEIDPHVQAPRTPDGKPDFSGLFSPGPVSGSELPYGAPVPFTNLPPRMSRASSSNIALGVPMTDAAEAILKARAARNFRDNPRSQCRPMGIVQLHTMGAPVKFLQTAGQLTLLYEANFERREIFLDGRALPVRMRSRPGTGTRWASGTATRSSSRPSASATAAGWT